MLLERPAAKAELWHEALHLFEEVGLSSLRGLLMFRV